MPIPTVITDLSTTAASNSPQGSESPTEGDNYLRAIQAIMRQEHDNLASVSAGAYGDAMVGWGAIVDIRDGVLTRHASLQAAVTSIGSTRCTVIVRDDVTMTANATFPATATLMVENGAQITTTGYTLTVSSFWCQEGAQCFSGTGTVVFAIPSVVSAAWFGALPSASAATNTTAMTSAATAVNSAGGGALVIPPGTYNIWGTLPGAVLCTFASLSNVMVVARGAKFSVGHSWAGTETQNVFQFTDCKNVYIDPPELSSTVQTAGNRASRGPKFITLLGNCENVHIPRIKATGALWVIGASALSNATEAQRSRGIHIGTAYADRCGYGMAWQFSGDDVTVGQWISAEPHRTYFPYGVRNHVINIESRDQYADDCILASYEGKGLDNIQLNYTNMQSTAAQSAAPCVTVAFNDQTAATIRNIRLNIRAHWPASGYFGYALHVYKKDNGGGYDATDRGHNLDGLFLTGVLSSAYSSAVPIRVCVDGTWGTGESVNALSIRDLSISGADSSTIQLSSAKEPAHFSNVNANGGFYVQGAPSTAPAKLVNCKAANFTSGTSDTGYADYVHCEATSGSLQSVTNKTFDEFNNAGVLARDFCKIGRGLLMASNTKFGDLTGTNNVFFVKLVSGLGAYFRFRYALVADQSDTNSVTRDETYGCKSFSATMNGSGVWTSQTAAANEVTERTLGTASAVTVSLVNGTSAGAYIAVACTNYNGANARASYVLEVMPMGAEAVLTNRCEAV